MKQIASIRYANGETEYYAESVPAAELTPAEPAEGTETRGGEEYVVKRYEIGELYDRNGVRGIVCCLSEDGRHGLVVSLDQIYLPWSEFRKPDLRTVGTTNRSDGRENMKIVEEYIAANGLSWDDFRPSSGAARRARVVSARHRRTAQHRTQLQRRLAGGEQPPCPQGVQRSFAGGRRQAYGPAGVLLLLDRARREERLHLAHEYRAAPTWWRFPSTTNSSCAPCTF